MSPAGREDIFERARSDGLRRLAAPPLVRSMTALVAGVVIAFGILADAGAAAATGSTGRPALGVLVGALLFAAALSAAIGSRLELFSESLYGTATATAGQHTGRWLLLGRLSAVTLSMNLLGAAALASVFAVDGALPDQLASVLMSRGQAVLQTPWAAVPVRGLPAGILLALLSYLWAALDVATARWVIAYMVGFMLAIGPFDYVVVSAPRLLFTFWLGGDVQYLQFAGHALLSTTGNICGALLFFVMTRDPAPRPKSS